MKRWTDVQVFFVYDTELLLKEEDDPRNAIIYFHPSEMPECLRYGLCCQLMGIVQFCKTVFSSPSLITLKKKKFAVQIEGRFVLGLAGSLDMPDSVLKRQLSFLVGVFSFYHKTLEFLFEKYNCISSEFEERTKSIFDYYLPISQRFGNTHSLTFNVVPFLDLPKSAGVIFLRATQILESCQSTQGVVAGSILCKNQVLYTQLPPSVVQYLWFISPHQPKIPAESVKTVYNLPEGVTLVYVYLTQKEIVDLKNLGYSIDERKIADDFNCTCAQISIGNSSNQGRNVSNCTCQIPLQNGDCDENVCKLVLYIQGHSETQLMLLLYEGEYKDPAKIIYLWKIGLSSLVDLEIDILSSWEHSPKKESPSNSSYLYIQFDRTWSSMKGSSIPSWPENINEQLFNRSSQLVHELLNDEDNSVESLSLICADTVIHSQSLGSLETHCQFNLPETDGDLDSRVKILSGIETRVKRQLEKDHEIMIY